MTDVVAKIRDERDQAARARDRAVEEVTRLDAKLAELDAALRVIDRFIVPESPARNGSSIMAKVEAKFGPQRGRQKQLIVGALSNAAPHGLTVAEIEAWILANHQAVVTPNTISVTLPRLRSAGIARLEGRHWFRVQDAETAGHPIPETPAAPDTQPKEPAMDPPS